MKYLILFFGLFAYFFIIHSVDAAKEIGVNYGLLGDNLPHPNEVVELLKSRKITKSRIFDPNPEVLKAFQSSDIEVIVGTKNEDLQQLSSDPSFAVNWVKTNIVPYHPAVKFSYVAAANEVIPGPLASYTIGAMRNLDAALKAENINIPVSTAVSFVVIGPSYPPSSGAFADSSIMGPIVKFLAEHNSSLLTNVYPYFSHVSFPDAIPLDYALGNGTDVVVRDGNFQYVNLFDAMIDSVYAALEKEAAGNVGVIVTESGWPSAEGKAANLDNAKTYVNQLIKQVTSGNGTPRRPGSPVETYIFAIFNENLKPAGIETNFGMYWYDMREVYHVEFPDN